MAEYLRLQEDLGRRERGEVEAQDAGSIVVKEGKGEDGRLSADEGKGEGKRVRFGGGMGLAFRPKR